MKKQSKRQRWAQLEKDAGLPQGSIADDRTADSIEHMLSNPAVYNGGKDVEPKLGTNVPKMGIV